MKVEKELLKMLVQRFRKAIDEAKNNGELQKIYPFSNFPKDCCDLASDLLSHYLSDYGIETYLVNGAHWDEKCSFTCNHIWLLVEKDLIVDITGDQFKNDPDYFNYNKAVHVGREENLHKQFNENRNIETKTDLEDMFNARSKTLRKVYDIIKKYL